MLVGTEPLDLGLTLVNSAQCFRWTRAGEWFGAVIDGAPVWLRRTDAGIEAEGSVDAAALRRYLDLDRDYAAVAREFEDIPAARQAMALYPGLRVLNQPPWEALVCFILSANNNVARIRSLVDALCRALGRPVDTPRGTLYGFPRPSDLACCAEAALRGLKVGYRAPYLVEAARRVLDGFPLDALSAMPFDEAHAALLTLPGVGDKVADCVLLFGCGHASAFPVDVWVARLLTAWFGFQGMSRPAMARAARAKLGPHAGIMQQFLFHAARTGDMDPTRPAEEAAFPCGGAERRLRLLIK